MRWFGIDPVSAGVFGVPAGAAVLVIVSLLSRRPSGSEASLVEQLQGPAVTDPVPAARSAPSGL
jgi:cation/acetate symporter